MTTSWKIPEGEEISKEQLKAIRKVTISNAIISVYAEHLIKQGVQLVLDEWTICLHHSATHRAPIQRRESEMGTADDK